MADKKLDLNALQQAFDTSWGRSSTPKTASYSVKLSLLGPDRVLASYAAVVNFVTERQMILQKRAYAEEAEAIVNEVMKHVKSNYKELAGQTLSVKELSAVDSVEIINMNVHTTKRTAYMRHKVVFEVG